MNRNRNRSRPLSPLVPLAVLAVLALSGCDGHGRSSADGPSSAEPAPATRTPEESTEVPSPNGAAVDPCTLVTKQEAEKLAGTALNPATPVQETCTYTGPVTGPTAQVEIFVGDGAKKYLDIERGLGHTLRPLAGVGDEAYAEDEAVFLRRSDRWVSIRLVRLNDPAENRTPLEELARKVATRI
ncbi:DUF3558 family protein [Streptomyces kebangsaanensis]|uniref:DUF3558 family protein n=1 Tax=Streptomyces kebangsaanensis TaxID=864058 RepID=UPI000938EA8F|nr:DUF3558 family protein [Streptomyces kebangsaanensis]